MRRGFWFVILSFFLSSCSSLLLPYHSEPLCKKGASGGVCGSLSEVYEDLEKEKQGKGKDKKEESLYEKEVKETITKLLQAPPTPVKVPDTILRVLILPYVGEDGSLNAAKYVFVKVEEGRWILGDYLIKERRGIKVLTPLKEERKEEAKEEEKKESKESKEEEKEVKKEVEDEGKRVEEAS